MVFTPLTWCRYSHTSNQAQETSWLLSSSFHLLSAFHACTITFSEISPFSSGTSNPQVLWTKSQLTTTSTATTNWFFSLFLKPNKGTKFGARASKTKCPCQTKKASIILCCWLLFCLWGGGEGLGVGDFRSNLFWGRKTEQSFNHSINPYQALPISIISIGTVLTCYIQHGKNNNDNK